MKAHFLVLASLMFVMSCNSHNNKNGHIVTDSIQGRERSWMSEFALPYNYDLLSDNNSLIFYYTKSLDTAITVHLKKDSGYLSCVFYWVTPQNRLAVSDIRNHENALTQFEGLSAKLDISIWDTISKQLNKNQFKLQEEQGYLGCCDMAFYFLSYGGQIYINNNKQNGERLKEVMSLLNEGVISKLRSMVKGQK